MSQTDHELFLLVRDPSRLRLTLRPGVTVVNGDMARIGEQQALLAQMDQAILVATAWGGNTQVINHHKTLELIRLLDPQVCQQIIYFSTASILDRQNQPLAAAAQWGTDYIRSKYECYEAIRCLESSPPVVSLFPTLVFGGDGAKPTSHLSAGIPQILPWTSWARFLKVEGSFHYIHAADIAQVVWYLVEHPQARLDPLVLGHPSLTVDQAVKQICAALGQRSYWQIPLTTGLINLLIWAFRIQMDPWSYFALQYRHFTHQEPVTPSSFGLQNRYPDLASAMGLRLPSDGWPAAGLPSG